MRSAILIALVSVCAMAQVRPQLMEEASRENLPSQKLGIDDLVAVSVYDAPELTRTVRVEADGTIHLPMLTEGVKAAGVFARDVEGALVAALKTEQILVDPVVKVTVAEYHSRPISVMGAVRKPLTFQAVGTATLVERSPLHRLLKDADPAINYQLHGGEEIRVPEAGKIFVLGNVKKPGAFPVRDAGDNSILKMVALSEGVLPYAAKLAYIYRRDANGDKREIPIEFDKIMQRKAADVALQVDDVLYIPDNKARRNTVNMIDRITSFGASTASGVLIWHQ